MGPSIFISPNFIFGKFLAWFCGIIFSLGINRKGARSRQVPAIVSSRNAAQCDSPGLSRPSSHQALKGRHKHRPALSRLGRVLTVAPRALPLGVPVRTLGLRVQARALDDPVRYLGMRFALSRPSRAGENPQCDATTRSRCRFW